MRVPGFTGSVEAAAGVGPQVSSAIRILLEKILVCKILQLGGNS